MLRFSPQSRKVYNIDTMKNEGSHVQRPMLLYNTSIQLHAANISQMPVRQTIVPTLYMQNTHLNSLNAILRLPQT